MKHSMHKGKKKKVKAGNGFKGVTGMMMDKKEMKKMM